MSKVRSSDIAQQIAKRRSRTQEILDGQLPTTTERLLGYPPCAGSERTDRNKFFAGLLAEEFATGNDVTPLHEARNATNADALWRLASLLPPLSAARDRTIVSLALEFGDAESQDILARQTRAMARSLGTVDAAYADSFASVLESHPKGRDQSKIAERVEGKIRKFARVASAVVGAGVQSAALEVPQSEPESPLAALARLAKARDEEARTPKAQPGRTLVVVPDLGQPTGSSARKDVLGQFKPISGVALPIVETENLVQARTALRQRFPYFSTEIDLVLRQARPYKILLLGSPGCGKTLFARQLAEELNLTSLIYPAAGASDSSFSGTSAQWSTSRASLPLQAVLRSRQANPLIVIDEIDKTDLGRNNGAFVDAALIFLEPSSARRMLDPALEVEVDLSQISYVATANALDCVPAPLCDRMRTIAMPDPGPEHAAALVANILSDIATERDVDPRWFLPLAQDEMELIERVWPGGSLRRLRRIVERMLDIREQQMGKA